MYYNVIERGWGSIRAEKCGAFKKVCSNFDRVFSLLTFSFTCQKRILGSQIRIPALGIYFLCFLNMHLCIIL